MLQWSINYRLAVKTVWRTSSLLKRCGLVFGIEKTSVSKIILYFKLRIAWNYYVWPWCSSSEHLCGQDVWISKQTIIRWKQSQNDYCCRSLIIWGTGNDLVGWRCEHRSKCGRVACKIWCWNATVYQSGLCQICQRFILTC